MEVKKRILILGISGQLGSALRHELEKNTSEFQVINSIGIDIREMKRTFEFITQYNPDLIINCAAWTNVRTAESHENEAKIVNGWAVENIGMASRKIGATLIHISTDYVFSGNSQLPYNENDSTDPINSYGRTKALGESLLKELEYDGLYILRTAWLYGIYRNNFIKTILNKYLSGEKTIEIVNDQFGNPTNVSDLAKHIIYLSNYDLPSGYYHGVNTGSTTWFGLAKQAFNLLDLDPNILIPVKSPANQIPKRPANSTLLSQKWNNYGLNSMRPWQDALSENIDSIFNQVREEKRIEF